MAAIEDSEEARRVGGKLGRAQRAVVIGIGAPEPQVLRIALALAGAERLAHRADEQARARPALLRRRGSREPGGARRQQEARHQDPTHRSPSP
ncbi:MAG: hypothetical protein WDN44_06005 [Sphingomonas sp.]